MEYSEKSQDMNEKKALSPKGRIILGLVLIAVYATLFHFLLWPGLKLSLESKKWPTVNGQIAEVNLLYHNGQVYRSEELWQNNGRHVNADEWSFHVQVKYQYVVEGEKYVNDQVRIRLGVVDKIHTVYEGNSLPRAKRIAERYRENASPVVYYHPEQHDMAVLKPGASLGIWALQLILFVFLSLGGLLLVVSGLRGK